jgi:hypothetical protein
MITDKAKAAIEWLFEQAIRGNSTLEPGGQCLIHRRSESSVPPEDTRRHVVVLTISSYTFRVVALFNFPCDAAMVGHMARLSRSPDAQLAGQALADAFAEWVNMICGAANRGLCTRFRHVGMSTPAVLESTCPRHVGILNPEHTRLIEVQIDDTVRFELLLCVCVAAESTLDFDVDRTIPEADAGGELEMF